LLHACAVDLVEIEQFLDLAERKAEPLAAQDPRQARAVARTVDADQALALRLDQPLVLVEADGARRHRELAGELGDAVEALVVARRLALGGRSGRRGGGRHGRVIVDVYVNVNGTMRKPRVGPSIAHRREVAACWFPVYAFTCNNINH